MSRIEPIADTLGGHQGPMSGVVRSPPPLRSPPPPPALGAIRDASLSPSASAISTPKPAMEEMPVNEVPFEEQTPEDDTGGILEHLQIEIAVPNEVVEKVEEDKVERTEVGTVEQTEVDKVQRTEADTVGQTEVDKVERTEEVQAEPVSPLRKLQLDLNNQKALVGAEKDRLRLEREKLKIDQEEFYARIQSVRSVTREEMEAELKAEREALLAERRSFLVEQEAQRSRLDKELQDAKKAQEDAKTLWGRAESVFLCQGAEDGLTAGAREMWMRADAARADLEAKIRMLEERELLAQLREDREKKEAEAKDQAEQKAREDKEATEQKAKEIREQMEGARIDLTFSARHLPTLDMTSKSDPFLVVFLQDPNDLSFSELGRTEPIMDDEDPVWKKSVTLPLDPKHNRDPVLRLMVFDEDCADADLSKHDFIGETFLKLSTILSHVEDKKGFPLKIYNATVTKEQETSLLFIVPKENEAHSQDKKKQVARKKVAEEIVSTERSYLNGLCAMGAHFGTPAQAVLSREDYETLFSAGTMLEAVNKAFLADVEARVAHWDDLHTTIGDLFVTFAPYFKLYTSYVNGHAKAELLTKTLLIRNKAFKALCEKGAAASGNTLQSFSILPIQRIPRYVLLLTELLKNTPDTHPDHQKITEAIPHVKNVATFVNKAMSGASLAEELLAIQSSFGPSCPDLLAPGRSLVHRALLTRVDLNKGERVKKYDFLLMSDIILFAKPSSSLISDDLRKLSGLLTIDDHFFVQDIDLSVDFDHPHQERRDKDAKDSKEGESFASPRATSPASRREFFGKMKSQSNLTGRPAFRIISHKAVSVWIADSVEDKMKWLDMFQRVATARMNTIEFKNRTGDMLYDGLPFNRVQKSLDPQLSTLLFLRQEKDGGQGWIHARVWYEERAQLVHVMLVEARDLPAADVNGFSDPYVTLSYYSVVELEAIGYHHVTHRAGRSLATVGSHKTLAMMAELPKDVQKLKPRWKSKTKVVKKNLNPYWGQHFTFSMSSAERMSRNKNLLVIEVFDWDQIGSDDFLGQCTFDLSYVPAFSAMAAAPPAYTKMPEPKSSELPEALTSPSTLRRWSVMQSKRNLDPAGLPEDSAFFSLLHSQAGMGGVKGRFYWVNKGSILLQKAQSFTTGEVLSIETGVAPAHLADSPLPLSERMCYLIVTAEDDCDDRVQVDGQLPGNGKLILNIQTESANVVRDWCCQLTQVLPMVRVVDKGGGLVTHSARQVVSTASSIVSVACDHFEKHLFRKRDLCRTCGLSRDEHAPEHRGKRNTVAASPAHLKLDVKPGAKSASQSMKLELPTRSDEGKLQRQGKER